MPLGVNTSYGHGGKESNQKKYKKKVAKNRIKKRKPHRVDLGIGEPKSLGTNKPMSLR